MYTQSHIIDPLQKNSFEEARYLERQEWQKGYRPIDDLQTHDYTFLDGFVVLDAGCGPGSYSEFLARENQFVDYSHHLLDTNHQYAETSRQKIKKALPMSQVFSNTNNLENSGYPNDFFDVIFCRNIYQHLVDHQAVSNELFRILRPTGKLIIIDSDEIPFNFVTDDEPLNHHLKQLRYGLDFFDPYVCRKIPAFLLRSGFQRHCISKEYKDIEFISPQDRRDQQQNWKCRFKQFEKTLKKIFSDQEKEDFINRFLNALMDPRSILQYEKRIIRAVKTI